MINPNNGDAYSLLGYILAYSGRADEGISFIRKAISTDPFPSVMYLFHLGVAYFESKQYQEAINTLEEAVIREPKHRGAHSRLAASYSLLGDSDNSKKALAEAIKIDPNLNLSGFIKKFPYKNKADLERYQDALRKAGMPE